MSEKWSKSESIAKLAEALAKAQSKFDAVLKDSSNPFFKSKYADLATVIGATQPHLAAEGLSVIQMPHAEFGAEDAKMLTLTTLLAHSSGEWISSDLTMPAMMKDKFDAQSVGSAITYARRYAWSAMMGVAQEDDDGNKATGRGTREEAQAVGAHNAAVKESEKEPAIVELVPWKLDTFILRGMGVSDLRAKLTDAEKTQGNMKWDKDARAWAIRAADGNLVASYCDKYKIPVRWIESNV